jgi:hypothetical protein
MKIVRIGNYDYRAKQCGKYLSGKDKYLYQFRLVLFGIIPLYWDSFYGTYSLEFIENDLKEKMKATGEIAELNL